MAPSLILFDSDKWQVKGSSLSSHVSQDGHQLSIVAASKTDWWRTATGSEPESAVNRNSGPIHYLEMPHSKTHWTVGAWISGTFEERFQQATLFLGVGEYSEQGAWAKAGIEVENEAHNVGVVVATPYSDWSILPLAVKIGSKQGTSKLYIQFTRVGADVFVHYALSSSKSTEGPPSTLQLLREIKGFSALATDAATTHKEDPWHVGVMVCGPLSEKTEAQWENFTVDYEKAASST